MEGLLWFLVLGGLFYFMMRFGCGAHMIHGHSGHGEHAHLGGFALVWVPLYNVFAARDARKGNTG
jgi:hypothetical protein